jgi:hypothetical protein
MPTQAGRRRKCKAKHVYQHLLPDVVRVRVEPPDVATLPLQFLEDKLKHAHHRDHPHGGNARERGAQNEVYE